MKQKVHVVVIKYERPSMTLRYEAQVLMRPFAAGVSGVK